jgi:hypothetical protein
MGKNSEIFCKTFFFFYNKQLFLMPRAPEDPKVFSVGVEFA